MKIEDVSVGKHKVGVFEVIIAKPVYNFNAEAALTYFEVLVHQEVNHGILYVDLVNDERFSHFKHMQSFIRNLTEEDIAEYNSHVSRVFHGLQMPTFKLSRRSISRLFDVCEEISVKIRREEKKKKNAKV